MLQTYYLLSIKCFAIYIEQLRINNYIEEEINILDALVALLITMIIDND